MKIVDAHQVKLDVMKYAFWERSAAFVVTEGLNAADVLSITSAMFAIEFEIKVSRSDLNKELAAIKYASMVMIEDKDFGPPDTEEQVALNLELGNLKNKSGGWSKISKHKQYIDPKKYFEKHQRYMLTHPYIPNYFYMVVPRNLVDYAIQGLDGTGYGVIAYNGCRSRDNHRRWVDGKTVIEECSFGDDGCREEITVMKKPKRIHSDKISTSALMSTAQRVCTENIRMLSEIMTLDKVIKDSVALTDTIETITA